VVHPALTALPRNKARLGGKKERDIYVASPLCGSQRLDKARQAWKSLQKANFSLDFSPSH
jgi:hypothetical protein